MSVSKFEDLDLTRQYGYADYLTWTFKERVELFRGWVVKMSRAPNRYHQQISITLSSKLFHFFEDHKCFLYAAPFDVRLPTTNGGETVVQSDLSVICDPTKLTQQGCTGAPDWVIEILSPGNTTKEMRDKFELYP